MGKKTLATYEKYGRDPKEELGTMDPLEIGRMVNRWNMEFLSSGPVAAVLLEGLHAIDNVRMIAGNDSNILLIDGVQNGTATGTPDTLTSVALGDFTSVLFAQAQVALVAAYDTALFVAAETHRAMMRASPDPLGYDFAGGWPAAFAG
jgi:hypothetical protein